MLSVNDDHQVLCKGAFSINRKVADSNKLKVCVAFLIPYLPLVQCGVWGWPEPFPCMISSRLEDPLVSLPPPPITPRMIQIRKNAAHFYFLYFLTI